MQQSTFSDWQGSNMTLILTSGSNTPGPHTIHMHRFIQYMCIARLDLEAGACARVCRFDLAQWTLQWRPQSPYGRLQAAGCRKSKSYDEDETSLGRSMHIAMHIATQHPATAVSHGCRRAFQ